MTRPTNSELKAMLARPRARLPAKMAVQAHLDACDHGNQGCHDCMAFGCCDNSHPILDALAELLLENEEMREALGRAYRYVMGGPHHPYDHACQECMDALGGVGEMVKPGFRCVWHTARAHTQGEARAVVENANAKA